MLGHSVCGAREYSKYFSEEGRCDTQKKLPCARIGGRQKNNTIKSFKFSQDLDIRVVKPDGRHSAPRAF